MSSDRPVLICFAGDLWNGNPHSRHHIMQRLRKRWEILWVDAVPMRSVAPVRGELRRVRAKLRARASLQTPVPGLHVLWPPPIPPAGRLGRRVQLAVLSRSIAGARAQLGLRGPAVAWFSLPVAAPLLGRLGECGSIFYYQDRYDEFNHVDRVYLRRCIATLARRADISVATSAALAKDLEALGASPLVVSHGVDLDRFAGDSRPPPDDVAGLERPLVGYVGLIDDYLALDHFVAVADRLERGTVVLIGSANTDVAALDHPRIRLLGQRPYDTMPAYLGAFDCCLIPFKPGRLSAGVDPIKMREYLAAGRPVVATAMSELAQYGDLVTIAHGSEEFARAVADTVRHETEDKALVARRRARVADESWDAVAQRLDQAIRPLLDR